MSTQFVSRGGEKLAHALKEFNLSVKDKICADLGCSTGGFTDCLLQHDAAKIYSVDTGYGVLDWKLRNDSRVVVKERTNALHLELPELMDFISIDASWTKQKLIIPKALELLKTDGNIVSLLKPQYEADKSWLDKGKVKPEYLEITLNQVKADLAQLNVNIIKIIESPILGEKGSNKEYLIWIKPRA